jgi:protein-S-isoprenylcysteine O-methyltransferase Ste14
VIKRIVALLIGATVFIGIIPLSIVVLSSIVEEHLQFPNFSFPLQKAISLFLATLGLLLSASAGWYQLKKGEGSPLPVVPARKLVAVGPYRFCRNPMALGAIVYYVALSIWLGSIVALVITGIVSCLFLIYIRMVEEKELERRFGEEYRIYKEKTPFLIPKLWRKS